MGDRAYCRVRAAARDAERFDFEEWGTLDDEFEDGSISYHDPESNGGGTSWHIALITARVPFEGQNDAGCEYRAYVQAYDGVDFAEVDGSDTPIVPVQPDGSIEPADYARAMRYYRVLGNVEAYISDPETLIYGPVQQHHTAWQAAEKDERNER